MKNLLQITQEILSDMGGDEVNSIFDTPEAEKVARIVVSTFNAMVSRSTWPHHRRLLQFTQPSDNTKPTHMTLTSQVKEMVSVYYDKIKKGETRKRYEEVKYKSPDDFLRYLNLRDNTASNIQVVTDTSGVELFILNDRAPTYYTSFDDQVLVFDAFDSAVDNTLLTSKIQAIGYIQPTLDLDNTAVPDLPVDTESALIEAATDRAQYKILEFRDIKAEQEANKQSRWISRRAWKTNSDRKYPDYGRH